jgi:hypothetical protein
VAATAGSLILSLVATANAAIIHVDGRAAPGGDGSTWALAYDDLRDALAAAVAGDELWVVAGTYAPAGPGGDRTLSFTIPSGVRVFGGFAGDEIDRSERDWVANVTILSGDLNGDDGPDFTGRDDNTRHVVRVHGGDPDTMLNGFTVEGGDAGAIDYGGGVRVDGGAIDLRHCIVRSNRARWGGGMYAEGASLAMRDCAIESNMAHKLGGGVYTRDGLDVLVEDCRIANNFTDVGAGLRIAGGSTLTVTDTEFIGNDGRYGGGAVFSSFVAVVSFTRCEFRHNAASDGVGGFAGLVATEGISATVTDCLFVDNMAGFDGAGLTMSNIDSTLVNCVFSRNETSVGGGILNDSHMTMINCTVGHNVGSGYLGASGSTLTAINSIFWGNSPEEIGITGASGASFDVRYCNVEGGFPGDGNIDADPIFVQPGTDNLRLSFGSPCLNAGDNDAVPAGVDTDLDGNPRIQDGVVDMGAYEGAHELEEPASFGGDIDLDDVEILIVGGFEFDPLTYATWIVRNVSGPDDREVTITQYDDLHPDAMGFGRAGPTYRFETTLADGEFIALAYLPFDESDLDGRDPLTLDLTAHDAGTGNWTLAVTANTFNSPGHFEPIGDRKTVVGGPVWGATFELGDYGVYWDPEATRGLVWAVVDHAGDFSLGPALCPADCLQPPDGAVDMDDLVKVLDRWGNGPGPYDVNRDGIVDFRDLLEVLFFWGGCAE